MIALLFALAASKNPACLDVEGDFCDAHMVSEPIRSCTDGWLYSEEENCCISEVSYPPLLACPGGEAPTPEGFCHCSAQPRVMCMDPLFSFDRRMNECVRSEFTPMIPSCAHRPDLAGELSEDGHFCKYFVEAFSRPKCQWPAKLHDGMCVTHNTLPDALVYTCPDGWTQDGNECTLIEQVACDKVKHKKCTKASKYRECDVSPFSPLEDDAVVSRGLERRLCHNCKETIKPEVVCQVADCGQVVAECHCSADGHCSGPCAARSAHDYKWDHLMSKERSVTTPVVCERQNIIRAKPVCLFGVYNEHKGTCCESAILEPEIYCSHEPHGPFPCNKARKYLPDHVCPAPFAVQCLGKAHKAGKMAHPHACECILSTEMPAVHVCKEGWTMEGDVCKAAIPAELYCPEADAELVNGICRRIEREAVRVEYNVTYVTVEECEIEDCIERNVAVKKRKVAHKEIVIRKGKAHTKCFDNPCVDINGAEVHEL